MKKKLILITSILCLSLFFVACFFIEDNENPLWLIRKDMMTEMQNQENIEMYDIDWIIGKSMQEIEEKYGYFDSFSYKNDIRCFYGYYYVVDTYYNIFEKSYGYDLKIIFDEDKVATNAAFEYLGAGG